MRPGRSEDLPRLVELWRREARAGRQDAVPREPRLRTLLQRFDWEARCRVVEESGTLTAAALVTSRSSPDGLIVTAAISGAPDAASEVTAWALRLARAGGARIVQVYAPHGARSLEPLGFKVVRPWLRMDRDLGDALPSVRPVPGYRLIDGTSAAAGEWGRMFNRSFADHWRFSPRGEDEVIGDKPAELCVMAVTSKGSPASIALGEVEEYRDDHRAQPVGLISSVGTLPDHRRRGLATWLVADLLLRLKAAGARSSALYVDGLNPTRAFDAYRKLGFEVAFESDVWEATVR
ncbi:MAG TPA: GNAT family N-acetyltransferase [Candidatus Udaeobacter sp.]|nr:GNAT family N-acetyltransferase [Candidatus Udaeobacter sp.]